MFDIRTLDMQVETPAPGAPVRVTIAPSVLYPALIARIQDVLAGANPNELLASSERGGSARADVLVNNSRNIPATAWEDALKPRDQFTPLNYFAFVEKNGRARPEMLFALNKATRGDVERMIYRGYALEIAMGWFCQALRLEFGAYDLTITRDDAYKL